jgi:hypothetical protein
VDLCVYDCGHFSGTVLGLSRSMKNIRLWYVDDTRMDPPKQEMSLLGYVVNPDSIGTPHSGYELIRGGVHYDDQPLQG